MSTLNETTAQTAAALQTALQEALFNTETVSAASKGAFKSISQRTSLFAGINFVAKKSETCLPLYSSSNLFRSKSLAKLVKKSIELFTLTAGKLTFTVYSPVPSDEYYSLQRITLDYSGVMYRESIKTWLNPAPAQLLQYAEGLSKLGFSVLVKGLSEPIWYGTDVKKSVPIIDVINSLKTEA